MNRQETSYNRDENKTKTIFINDTLSLLLPLYNCKDNIPGKNLKSCLEKSIITYENYLNDRKLECDTVTVFTIEFSYIEENYIPKNIAIILTPTLEAELINNSCLVGALRIVKDHSTYLFLIQDLNPKEWDYALGRYCRKSEDEILIAFDFAKIEEFSIVNFMYEGHIDEPNRDNYYSIIRYESYHFHD